MADTVPLYNPNDGLTGRDGGPYLDQEEARIAEERRARVEKRKPDYDHPGATAGIQLVTAAQLIHQVANVRSVASMNNDTDNAEKMIKAIVDDDSNNFVVQGEIRKDEVRRLQKEAKDRELSGEDFSPNDPNAPVDATNLDVFGEPITEDGESTKKSSTSKTSSSK